MDWFLGDDDDDFGKKSFYFNHFFFPGIKSRSPFDFCARTTFVGERHHRIRYGSTLC